ncbi:MBL fold metallo-hydrolase [Paenibacillus campinasensis]|uniref:Metallo-beta-lactamase domain-containing protein n=1 Tax=Paenibacillus campinasensis TaxID=66347 RepID=A0A268EXN6_9BACL|nr:MBL fold metallo-hydrolase [Paenibacillus campinasensis]PAD77885.1 hypothetical protein CHH67_07760 [Paenibacillus campinasensis]
MKLTVIGHWGAFPPANGATSSYLLEEGDFSLLIDCGSGSLSSLQNYIPLQRLDALIVSHYHHDHKADIGCLQYGMLIQSQLGHRTGTFPIYGHSQDADEFSSLTFRGYTEGHAISPEYHTVIGPWEVSFCPTTHPAYCLAMRFTIGNKSLVYTADTHWTDDLVDFARNCDLLLCEASVLDDNVAQSSGHMTPEMAGQLAAQSGAASLVLTHLPQYAPGEVLVERARQVYSGSIQLASSGLQLEL